MNISQVFRDLGNFDKRHVINEWYLDIRPEIAWEIVQYMNHHKGNNGVIIEKPLRSKIMKDVCKDPWDAEFIDRIFEKDRQDLYDLTHAANLLDINCLIHLACARVAAEIKGVPLEEIKDLLAVGENNSGNKTRKRSEINNNIPSGGIHLPERFKKNGNTMMIATTSRGTITTITTAILGTTNNADICGGNNTEMEMIDKKVMDQIKFRPGKNGMVLERHGLIEVYQLIYKACTKKGLEEKNKSRIRRLFEDKVQECIELDKPTIDINSKSIKKLMLMFRYLDRYRYEEPSLKEIVADILKKKNAMLIGAVDAAQK